MFYPTILKGYAGIFSPMVSKCMGGRWEKACPGCISETVMHKMLTFGRDICWRGLGVQCHDMTLI